MRNRAAIESWVGRDDRYQTQLPLMVTRIDGSTLAANISNISYEGCQLEADTMLRIGEKITLALPRMGEIKAQIRWATVDGKAGARFLSEEIRAGEPHSRARL